MVLNKTIQLISCSIFSNPGFSSLLLFTSLTKCSGGRQTLTYCFCSGTVQSQIARKLSSTGGSPVAAYILAPQQTLRFYFNHQRTTHELLQTSN